MVTILPLSSKPLKSLAHFLSTSIFLSCPYLSLSPSFSPRGAENSQHSPIPNAVINEIEVKKTE